jgi:hypothetical protein
MVEAVAIMPVFVVLFFTAVYAHSWGAKQIDLNSQSRQASWVLAMANCNVAGQQDSETLPASNTGGTAPSIITLANSNPNEAGSAARSAFSAGSVTGAMSSFLSNVTSLIAGIFPNPSGAQLNKSDTLNWRMPNNYTGANPTNSTTVQGNTTVMCNEAPMNGTIANLL